MLHHLRPAVVLLVLLSAVTGLLYPLALTGVAEVALPRQAEGSLVRNARGEVVASRLVGQDFEGDRYFHGRPSATTAPDPKDASKTIAAPYNASNSAGSNYGPTSKALVDRVKGDVAALRKAGLTAAVPADAVTTSASGLDPDISPEFALVQVPRVARARKLPEEKVRALVTQATNGGFVGLIGERRVHVLELNLELDDLKS